MIMSFLNVSNTYDYMNSFFGNNSTNGSSGASNFLGDYYAVQNGSYYKLAKNYYAKAAKEEAESAEVSKKSVELVKSGTQETINSLNISQLKYVAYLSLLHVPLLRM